MDTRPSRIATLAKLVVSIVAAAVLVALVALPFVGGTGLVVKSSADIVNSIPDTLTVDVPESNTVLKAANGKVITEFYDTNRVVVESDQIAPVMKQALVDIEDSRFYEHNGVDVEGTARALVTNLVAGSVQEGGSTLTQQLVKQTLLQAADTEEGREEAAGDSVSRKLREARYALALEKKYSKDEILTRYLNMVYFGEGAYGIQAASQKYFSVDAADLTLAQASVLAGLVQSPTDDDPIQHPEAAATRRNEVLNRMHTLGHITDEQLADRSARKVKVVESANPPNGCASAKLGGYFCDYVVSYLTDTVGLSENDIKTGGYTITTTLNTKLQKSSDQSILQNLPGGADGAFAGVLDAVEPGTGHVLAMGSNRQYGCSASEGKQCESLNLNTRASFGSGSTYKVFTAAAALEAGYGSNYSIYAPQPYYSKVYKGTDKDGNYGPLKVFNDDSYYKSTYNMTSGLVASSNTYYVGLEDALGSVKGPVETAKALGMHFDDPNQLTNCGGCKDVGDYFIDTENGTFTLGPIATSPLDLANAYATIAASGTRCDPTPLTAIKTASGEDATGDDGTALYAGDSCKEDAIDPAVADTLANMMTGVVSPSGTGRKAQISGHTIAGKTGTTQDNKTAAFVGMTPDYAASVMYFDPKGKTLVGGVGGGIPGLIWHDAFQPVLSGTADHKFPAADPAVAKGTKGTGYVAPSKSSSSSGSSASSSNSNNDDDSNADDDSRNSNDDNANSDDDNSRNDDNDNGGNSDNGGGNDDGGDGDN